MKRITLSALLLGLFTSIPVNIKAATTIIDRINEGLKTYYQDFDREYDNLFADYCDDNGIDDGMVEEELQGGPTDSLLVGFDDNFPIEDDNIDGDARNEEIFDLLIKLKDQEVFCRLKDGDLDLKACLQKYESFRKEYMIDLCVDLKKYTNNHDFHTDLEQKQIHCIKGQNYLLSLNF